VTRTLGGGENYFLLSTKKERFLFALVKCDIRRGEGGFHFRAPREKRGLNSTNFMAHGKKGLKRGKRGVCPNNVGKSKEGRFFSITKKATRKKSSSMGKKETPLLPQYLWWREERNSTQSTWRRGFSNRRKGKKKVGIICFTE